MATDLGAWHERQIRLGTADVVAHLEGRLRGDLELPSGCDGRDEGEQRSKDSGVVRALRAHLDEDPIQQLDPVILADDPRLDHAIQLRHRDGTHRDIGVEADGHVATISREPAVRSCAMAAPGTLMPCEPPSTEPAGSWFPSAYVTISGSGQELELEAVDGRLEVTHVSAETRIEYVDGRPVIRYPAYRRGLRRSWRRPQLSTIARC